MTDMRICRKCSAEFKRSPADTTVNCPDCRASARTRAAADTVASRAHDMMIARQMVARTARREHGIDHPVTVAATADFTAAREYYESVRGW